MTSIREFKKQHPGVMRAACALLLCLSLFCVTLLMSGVMDAYRIVTVNDSGAGQQKFATLKTEVDQMLSSQNISTIPEDEISVTDDGHDMTITIDRAVDLSVAADGTTHSLTIRPSATVADALAKADVTVGGEDMVSVDQTTPVSNGLQVVVQRVSRTARAVPEPIPYQQVQQPTGDLFQGETKLQTAGQNGELTRYYEDTVVDGVVTATVEVGSNITVQPVNEVVLVGTKQRAPQKPARGNGKSELALPASVTLDANGIPTNYKNVISGRGTAYSGGGTTSTGRAASPGYVAVNPSVIPYGTQMYIVAQDGYVYGYAIAADCGGALFSGAAIVDLYMHSESECYSFGSRMVNVYIL